MNTFDKNLRKKLYNAELEVSEGMWASIESQIPVKKEKPKLWFFFLLSAAIIAFGYVFNQSADTPPATVENELDNTTLTGTQNLNDNHLTDSDIKNVNIQEKATNLSTNHPITIQPTRTNRKAITSAKSNEAKIANTYKISEKNHYPTNDFNDIVHSSKKLKFVVNPFKITSSNRSNNSLKLIEKSRINQIGKVLSNAATIDNKKEIPLVAISNLGPLKLNAKEERYSVATCPKFEQYSSGIYFFSEAYFGKNFQHLSTNDLELSGLVNRRTRNEMSAVSLSATLGIGKEFRNGLLAETGINYDRIRMSFRLDRTQEIIEHVECINDQGVVFTKSDTTIVSNPTNLNNTFTQVNIPLVIGYRHYVNNRLSIAGKIGTLLNLNSSNQGQFLDNNDSLVTYNSNNVSSSLFQTNLDLSYLASIQVQAQLGSGISAYLGVNSNFYPSNFGLLSNPIQQRYTKVGLSFGVSYQI